jgi:hypothetical protein
LSERIGQEMVELVPAVVADRVAEKAGADAKGDLVHGRILTSATEAQRRREGQGHMKSIVTQRRKVRKEKMDILNANVILFCF